MSGAVRVGRGVVSGMVAAARAMPGMECCGLLAGSGGTISVLLTAGNALRSPTAYEIDPAELAALFRRMRADGLEHMGIYHSHPGGDNSPSPTDIDRAFYPAATYFILSPHEHAPKPVRAFRIIGEAVRELEITAV